MAAPLTILAVANRVIRHLSRLQLEEAQMIHQLEEAQTIRQLVVVPMIRQLVVVPMIHQQEVTQTILHLQAKIQPAHVMTYKIPLLS